MSKIGNNAAGFSPLLAPERPRGRYAAKPQVALPGFLEKCRGVWSVCDVSS